jgi:hypothetical protein
MTGHSASLAQAARGIETDIANWPNEHTTATLMLKAGDCRERLAPCEPSERMLPPNDAVLPIGSEPE